MKNKSINKVDETTPVALKWTLLVLAVFLAITSIIAFSSCEAKGVKDGECPDDEIPVDTTSTDSTNTGIDTILFPGPGDEIIPTKPGTGLIPTNPNERPSDGAFIPVKTGSGTKVKTGSGSTSNVTSMVVTATVYQGVESQTDGTPNVTSIQAEFNPTDPPRWIAVSRDLLKVFPYGTGVELQGAGVNDGVYIVMDTMAKHKTNQIDILISSNTSVGDPSYGKWNNVIISKLYPNVTL